MIDNTDVQEIHDGKRVDMRIESLMHCILHQLWSAQHFDTLFNEVMREFVSEDTPLFNAARVGREGPSGYNAVGLLLLLRFEFSVTYPDSPQWPGLFEYMPDAKYAVNIFYPNHPIDDQESTSYSPGMNLNQAVLFALVQYARERSLEIHNQIELRLN